jgi:hypothetical protein
VARSEITGGGWTFYQQVFVAALLLALAYDTIDLLTSLYLRPLVVGWLSSLVSSGSNQTAFLQSFDAESFYSNVIQNLIDFVFGILVFLYVFFRLGSRFETDPGPDYLRLLEFSFLGGIAGYILGYLVQVGIIWAGQGGFVIGFPWNIYVLQFLISLIRESIFMAAFAFTGVYLGYLRAKDKPIERPATV